MGNGKWTAETFGKCLVAEVQAMQGGAMILSRGGSTGRQCIDATSHCLKERSLERRQLLSWANCQARGTSFEEICEEFGWARSTVDRRNGQIKAVIAAWLNLRATLGEALDSGETAE